jgi:hypothetical protein
VPVLTAIQRVQRHVAGQGFPTPTPLVGPVPLGRGLGTAETARTGGSIPDATAPEVRTAMAAGLHRLFTLARSFVDDEALARRVVLRPGEGVFPAPHSPVFDFDATGAGAAWIEALAARAARIVAADDGTQPVVTHVDWRAEHLRYEGAELVAVYDWDSLRVDRESVAVGQVAHAYTVDWSSPTPHVPTGEEARAFVRCYEAARGAPFDDRAWRAVRAAWVYCTAYAARCEHALLGTDVVPPDQFRALLAAHGDEWLQ